MKQRSENGSSEESQSHKIYGCQRNRARRAPGRKNRALEFKLQLPAPRSVCAPTAVSLLMTKFPRRSCRFQLCAIVKSGIPWGGKKQN